MKGTLSCRRLLAPSARRRAAAIFINKRLISTAQTPPPPPTTPTTTTQQQPQQQQRQPKVIFSGIQPTGVPHLGNYLGALQQWKRMQDDAADADFSTKLIFCIVDLHAITVPRERGLLGRWKREMLAALLAIGIDPERSTVFYQSSVPAHSELQWILSCTASTGYLSRMTQWKSKIQVGNDASLQEKKVLSTLKHGLFSYPVLQAADILVHRATHVPVGEDQRQHLEFARECVTNFNHTYGGQHLVPPETILSPSKRVMSLKDPLSKMSKSDRDPASRILLTDSAAETTKKILGARTDSQSSTISYSPADRPGVSNLLRILSHFDPAGKSPEELATEMSSEGASLKDLKERVVQAVNGELEGVRERYAEIMARDREDGGEWLRGVVEMGGWKARESAEETMKVVREAVELGV